MRIAEGDTVTYHDVPGDEESYLRTGIVTKVQETPNETILTLRHPERPEVTWTEWYRADHMTVSRPVTAVTRRGRTLSVGEEVMVAVTPSQWVTAVIKCFGGTDRYGETVITVALRGDDEDLHDTTRWQTWPA